MDFLKLSGKEFKCLLAINILVVFSINIYVHGIGSILTPAFLAVWIGTVIQWMIWYFILRGIWRFFKRIGNRS